MTPVVFRKLKDGGDILALLPAEDAGQGYCMSYQHVGQHSGADYTGCIAITTPATPEEYKGLLAELVSIGYDDLKIYKRSPSWRQLRH